MATTSSKKKSLIFLFIVSFIYMIVELAVAQIGGAKTLLTDAFHMLSDVVALVIGFIAMTLSPKKWDKNTFGWARTEILGALVNAVFLLALCFSILIDAINKFIYPEKLDKVGWILGVGTGGLIINLIGICMVHDGDGHNHAGKRMSGHSSELIPPGRTSFDSIPEIRNKNRLTRIIGVQRLSNSAPSIDQTLDENDIESQISKTFNSPETPKKRNSKSECPVSEAIQKENWDIVTIPEEKEKKAGSKKDMGMRSVFLHLLADTLNSIVVIVVAGVALVLEEFVDPNYEKKPEWEWVIYLDPILTVIIIMIICTSTWPLLQETSYILLQNVPSHLNMKTLEQELLFEVKGITGVHEFHIWQLTGDKFYASIHIQCSNPVDFPRISKETKLFFRKHGIRKTTVQLEAENEDPSDPPTPLLKSPEIMTGNPNSKILTPPNPDTK